ncbi:auxin-responsive protein SAUR68-like [Diospyros lotus]|uniref:auxin-responsive protein SAUR68-like n=1 Tax=Diospyros lotus TaxID=55363 RepID=UPI00225A3966|nr:auxin-responsive protein SAUR68-like [Diospyros lotus]
MAGKWKRLAVMNRKRIIFPIVAEGHFVVYTTNQRRFVVPLAYLSNGIFKELLRLAEEEYGLPSHEPIMLPCDLVLMEYAVSFIRRYAEQAGAGEITNRNGKTNYPVVLETKPKPRKHNRASS